MNLVWCVQAFTRVWKGKIPVSQAARQFNRCFEMILRVRACFLLVTRRLFTHSLRSCSRAHYAAGPVADRRQLGHANRTFCEPVDFCAKNLVFSIHKTSANLNVWNPERSTDHFAINHQLLFQTWQFWQRNSISLILPTGAWCQFSTSIQSRLHKRVNPIRWHMGKWN